MSLIDSRLTKANQHYVFIGAPVKVFCNANEALRNALQKLETGVKDSLLLRCDELPFVLGDEGTIETVFLNLINLIAEKKATSNKIYLHIRSVPDGSEAPDHSLLPELSRYFIQFHTNITPCTEWMKDTDQKISNLTALLAAYGGSVAVYPLKNSGCIVSVLLPGKL